MPFPLFAIPVAVPAAVTALLLVLRRPAAARGVVVEPPLPTPTSPVVPTRPTTPVVPIIPGQGPKIPGTDRPVPGTEGIFVMAPRGLSLRTAPSVTAPRVAAEPSIPNNTVVIELEHDVNAPPPPPDADGSEQFGWSKVRTARGNEGFVANRFLSSSGVPVTVAERQRQEKERELSEREAPIFAGQRPDVAGYNPTFGYAPWRSGTAAARPFTPQQRAVIAASIAQQRRRS